jgi:hypothetical protein
VGTQNCLWVSYAVKYLLAKGVNEPRRAKLLARKAADEKMFMADLDKARPDVLLTETPALEAWARGEPALAGLFDSYHLGGKVGAISIWLKHDPEKL